MWKRLAKIICCPLCNDNLELCAFDESSIEISNVLTKLAIKKEIFDHDFNRYTTTGLLLCHTCEKWFPILHGTPILVPYITSAHEKFSIEYKKKFKELDVRYNFPKQDPVIGEQFVMESFSKEWMNYRYDGVIWGMNYDDHEKRFLQEIGFNHIDNNRVVFLEIGSGLGITTYLAHKNFEADAVGVDLSLAVVRASEHYRMNPFLHFILASAFHLPFKKNIADIVYSHGVLHHTYSTYEAFKSIATYCRPGGLLYIWVYGSGSKKGSILRRAAYLAESITRPLLSRHVSSRIVTMLLSLVACGYIVVNAFHRARNPHVQKYDYSRALHAARDRFTPLYAQRQDYDEVFEWFQEAGCKQIEAVDWQSMPPADQENYRRNTGVRGKRRNLGHSSFSQRPA